MTFIFKRIAVVAMMISILVPNAVLVEARVHGPQSLKCEDFGYDIRVANAEHERGSYDVGVLQSGYSISVNGNADTVNWNSSKSVDGVISKAATYWNEESAGTSGTVSKSDIGPGKHAISHIIFCAHSEIEIDPIEGCTDAEATNYNTEAEVDDSSCVYPEPTPDPLYGCTDVDATNYNARADTEDSSCTYPEVEVEPISGCTDSEATNYTVEAEVDDNSCVYPETTVDPVYGCTDTEAANYDVGAEVDNGSCVYPEPTPDPVYGCTDVDATNYTVEAEVDDNSCTYPEVTVDPIEGCTDTEATNYDVGAEVDDSSCIYPEVEEETAPVSTTSSGGGSGTRTVRCELGVTDNSITAGALTTLTWDTTRADEVALYANGVMVFESEENDDADRSMTVAPTADTKYELVATRGSRERTCVVEVEVAEAFAAAGAVEQPLVAGIALSAVPHTGAGDAVLTIGFYALLGLWSLFLAYLVVARKTSKEIVASIFTPNYVMRRMA